MRMKGTTAAVLVICAVLSAANHVLMARTLEKKGEADPVMTLRQENKEERKRDQAEIQVLNQKINELKAKLQEFNDRLYEIEDASIMEKTVLDEMHNIINRKEVLQKELLVHKDDLAEKEKEFAEKEIKRKDEVEALMAELKKDARKQRTEALKQDLRKYEKIIASPSVKGMNVEKSAWKALAVKYPKEAAGLSMGDTKTLQFRVNYGGICNSVGMRFALIQAGTFSMGSPEKEKFRSSDEIRHRVTLKKSFYLQTTEVTQAQWVEIMGYNPSEFKAEEMDRPVENVSWDDCQTFIEKLNKLEKTHKYRLPTEAEWEYACRAGRTSAFSNGVINEDGCGYDPNLDEVGWYCGNSGRRTHPVSQKMINAWGLYDMHGNVWEWCRDWYGKYPTDPVVDPEGERYGPKRVIRGGSCLNYAEKCRSAYRFSYPANVKRNNIGFRIARTQ